MKLLVHAGGLAGGFMDDRQRNLSLRHIEVYEIFTFVLKKQKQIRHDESDLYTGDQYTFVAFDQDTKLVPNFVIGKRTAANCEHFMLDLADRIKAPKRGEPKIRLQISSDGFAAYPGAVDLAFADTVEYGMIIKSFKEDQEAPGRYGPPEVTCTERIPVIGDVDPWSICTSHVERNNLTIRTFIRRFTRLSLGFSKKHENLVAAVQLHTAHYNFCRRHATLRMTPTMAVGVTGELWSLERLIDEIEL